jgi:hypothetical protein
MRARVALPTIGVLTMLCGTPVFAAPVVVACGPGQHAIVREDFLRGAPVTRVECASGARSVRSERYATSERVVRPRRSWGKSALVIGGSAGTGAGIGGMVRGRKGALIGAALGGGAASLYEGARRR